MFYAFLVIVSVSVVVQLHIPFGESLIIVPDAHKLTDQQQTSALLYSANLVMVTCVYHSDTYYIGEFAGPQKRIQISNKN